MIALQFDGDKLNGLAAELRKAAQQFPPGDERGLLVEERFLKAQYGIERKVHANNRGYDYVGPIIYAGPNHYYQWDKLTNTTALHFKGNIVALIELDDRTHNRHKDAERDAITADAGYRTVRWHSKNKPTIADIRARLTELAAIEPMRQAAEDAPLQ